MDELLKSIPGDTAAMPKTGASRREQNFEKRPRRFVFSFVLLAFFSSIAGYQAARFESVWTNSERRASLQRESVSPPASDLVSATKTGTENYDAAELSHLPPQQQAERLLELAIHRDASSLDLIRQNLEGWRGHLQDTGNLFRLVLAALDSSDLNVRAAAVEIDLAANNLQKSPQSVAQLLKQIRNDPERRYLALWRLGALGNRGVEPSTVLSTLLRYAHNRDQQTRFWAVEGLAMLGTGESIDPLLSILAHDPSLQVRQRAARDLGQSGMFTEARRFSAVPHLLNLLDDDSLDRATLDLVYATLQAITGAPLGNDPVAWREWWAHHGNPKKQSHFPEGLTLI